MKNPRLKKLYVFFSSVFIFMIHLPFTFAKSKDAGNKLVTAPSASNASSKKIAKWSFMYDSLKLNVMGLSQQAYDYAVTGLQKLKEAGRIANDQLISIADFSKSSSQKRLFVIDLENHRVLFNTYVAHGHNSGDEFASRFSNRPESLESSLGFYETSDTYNGKNGYSLHLQGLENGINDRADERAIVMHGAPYVSEQFIKSRGYIGRSWGCPAIPEKLTKPIINRIKNGTCLFIYSPDNNYLSYSKLLGS